MCVPLTSEFKAFNSVDDVADLSDSVAINRLSSSCKSRSCMNFHSQDGGDTKAFLSFNILKVLKQPTVELMEWRLSRMGFFLTRFVLPTTDVLPKSLQTALFRVYQPPYTALWKNLTGGSKPATLKSSKRRSSEMY